MKMHRLKSIAVVSLAAAIVTSMLTGTGCAYGGCETMCSGMLGNNPPGAAENLVRTPHGCCCAGTDQRCVAETTALPQNTGILNPGMPVHTGVIDSPEFGYSGAGSERHTLLHGRQGPIAGKAPALYILNSAFIC